MRRTLGRIVVQMREGETPPWNREETASFCSLESCKNSHFQPLGIVICRCSDACGAGARSVLLFSLRQGQCQGKDGDRLPCRERGNAQEEERYGRGSQEREGLFYGISRQVPRQVRGKRRRKRHLASGRSLDLKRDAASSALYMAPWIDWR